MPAVEFPYCIFMYINRFVFFRVRAILSRPVLHRSTRFLLRSTEEQLGHRNALISWSQSQRSGLFFTGVLGMSDV